MFNPLNLIAQAGEWDFVPEAPAYQPGSYWFPERASSFAGDVDWMFYVIFWVSAFFFAAIVGAMIYFVVKYRRRPDHAVEKSPSHNTLLEITWSILPGFLLIWFFVEGTNGYMKQRVVPGDAEEIHVIAQKWNWLFLYPNGDMSDQLHMVRNRPVKFILESRDILHAFFVPVFRQKQDIVPGRYGFTWVRPTATGTWRLYCAEYCGDGHSMMKTNVTVHETAEARDAATLWPWGDKSPIENGERLFNMQCSGCHNASTVAKTGPGLAEIWGKEEDLLGGGTVTVDENYFRESLENPNAKIVAGFTKPSQMTSFQGKLSPDQMLWLMAYIKSLSGIMEESTTDTDASKSGGDAASDQAGQANQDDGANASSDQSEDAQKQDPDDKGDNN